METPKPGALIATGLIIFGGSNDALPALHPEVSGVVAFRHDHLPDTELHGAFTEPVVARITGANITITPPTGALRL